MKKTLAALLALAGVGGMSPEVIAISRLAQQQRKQPRTTGSMRRSGYALAKEMGQIPVGTRAVNRGHYPTSMIANCEKMRARNTARIDRSPIEMVNGASYRASEFRNRSHYGTVESQLAVRVRP